MKNTRTRIVAALTVLALAIVASASLFAQQVPIPKTPAEVPGPAPGTAMTKEYVQMVGRMAYLWGWALVDNANRHKVFSEAPEPGLLGGVVPIAHNGVAMLTNYVSPEQRFVACTNQDVVYGMGYCDNLDKLPIVFQVPDFGDRFWVFALYDARTDEFSNIGKQYGTKPGFYMIVGPEWKGETPAGIQAVVRSSTSVVAVCPRVFMDDTAEDHKVIQPVLSQIDSYPLSKFDGKMKTKDWSKLPHYPAPKRTGKGETQWVNPETFFDELPAVMKQVPPLPGEEALYSWIGSVLEAAAKDLTFPMNRGRSGDVVQPQPEEIAHGTQDVQRRVQDRRRQAGPRPGLLHQEGRRQPRRLAGRHPRLGRFPCPGPRAAVPRRLTRAAPYSGPRF